MEVSIDDDLYIFNCPHCNDIITVKKSDVHCKIFRHAVYKKDFKPVPPHSKKEVCDELVEKNKVYGCCKPFRFIGNKNKYLVEKCDYI